MLQAFYSILSCTTPFSFPSSPHKAEKEIIFLLFSFLFLTTHKQFQCHGVVTMFFSHCSKSFHGAPFCSQLLSVLINQFKCCLEIILFKFFFLFFHSVFVKLLFKLFLWLYNFRNSIRFFCTR